MKHWLHKSWKANKSFILFVFLMFVFRGAVADWNEVPTGSMKPTIIEGDRILVNQMAYDLRIPFTRISLFNMGNPQRGDIVIFDSHKADKRLVKRVIGVPGDIVAMRNNQLIINGSKLRYENVAGSTTDFIENLFDKSYRIRINPVEQYQSSFAIVTVPEDHYLVLGDNRDNSADSRVIGFVPRDEITGRSKSVIMSLDYENYYLPRKHRYFEAI